MQRKWRTVIFTFVGVSTLAVLATAFEIRNVLTEPGQTPVKVDAVIVLGGGASSRRLGRGAELYLAGYAPTLIAYNASATVLSRLGVPDDSRTIILGPHSTWDEALKTRELVGRFGWKRIIVVTDPLHIHRSRWAFETALAPLGAVVVMVASPLPAWDADAWWKNTSSRRYVLLECAKMVHYRMVYGLGSVFAAG
ncbi:MAG: hypothetical protein FD165_1158 [Gammaproteobacteria bacterium]|nr:MAG: hypothetical protein FD165_1158 [Gammaproteobacteria bacterium]TND07317.1 MAG: hypothetical protein FD120_55 [Gammaproteobacteria bacterium]